MNFFTDASLGGGGGGGGGGGRRGPRPRRLGARSEYAFRKRSDGGGNLRRRRRRGGRGLRVRVARFGNTVRRRRRGGRRGCVVRRLGRAPVGDAGKDRRDEEGVDVFFVRRDSRKQSRRRRRSRRRRTREDVSVALPVRRVRPVRRSTRRVHIGRVRPVGERLEERAGRRRATGGGGARRGRRRFRRPGGCGFEVRRAQEPVARVPDREVLRRVPRGRRARAVRVRRRKRRDRRRVVRVRDGARDGGEDEKKDERDRRPGERPVRQRRVGG
mmetsp:Transcript_5300/g.22477  ORF Transcript_5300/g.22477 Transcript_5300/m.22477 type:complete len:271 (-) Transcript_5300:1058-1870(-)